MMNSRQSFRAEQSRHRRAAIAALAVLATLAMTVVGMLTATPARAESRSDAVKDKQESQRRIEALNGELDGIDQELADVFIALEQTRIEVFDLQDQLATAEQELADAERRHAQIVAQLEDAIALGDEIATEIQESEGRESELNVAVGNMAREMYRGESVSPLQVVVNMDDLGEISSRAAAATALSRAQSKAIDDVRTGLVISQNQAEKQAAVTARITELEAEAKQAAIDAEEARDNVAGSLAAVQAKQSELEIAQADWETRKAEAKTQLESATDDLQAAAARIAAIDKAEAEKRAAEEAARIKQEQEAAKNKPSTPGSTGGGSSSGSGNSGSSGGSAGGGGSSSGAMFANPFSFYAPVTSYFGWRLHPILGYYRLHDGTDFGAACGTTQMATRGGTVVGTGYNSGLGNYVTINHGVINGSSYITQHGHLSAIYVSYGQSVSQGTAIGATGTTGNSTGCHLHLTLYLNGEPVSILPYM